MFETGFGNAIEHIAKFGFGDAALIRNGSLALGGGNASPLDMAQGYAVFANGGHAISPYVIDAIFGPEGETLYRADPQVVCEPCDAEPAEDHFVRRDEEGNPLGAAIELAWMPAFISLRTNSTISAVLLPSILDT